MSSAAAVYGALRVKVTHMIHLYFDEEMTTIQYSARFGREEIENSLEKKKKTENKLLIYRPKNFLVRSGESKQIYF